MEPIKLTNDGKVKLPQPDEISKKQKDDAMGAYLMMFAAWAAGLPLPFLNLLAAVIYYFVNKKESRFVAFHSFQSLVTQFVVSIFNGIFVVWTVRNLFLLSSDVNNFKSMIYLGYLFFVIVWNLIYTVYSIIACVKAYRGEFFYMLFFGRLTFSKFYGKNAQNMQKKVSVNNPPEGF